MKVWKIDKLDDFYKILMMSEDEVEDMLEIWNKNKCYETPVEIKKKNGTRLIYPIIRDSKIFHAQERLKDRFLNNIMLAQNCYGYRKDNSYFDFLSQHCGYTNKYFAKFDIKSFFDSITYDDLSETFDQYFVVSENLNMEEKEKILEYFLQIITLDDKLIQGALTSPVVSNIIFRKLDIRIQKYCQKTNVEYTRYADDLLFSSESKICTSNRFSKMISIILLDYGFKLNYKKMIRTKDKISLNGIVIGDSIDLSRKKMKEINTVIYMAKQSNLLNSNDINGLVKSLNTNKEIRNFTGKYELINYLLGYRSFVISLLRYTDKTQKYKKYLQTINTIEELTSILQEIRIER